MQFLRRTTLLRSYRFAGAAGGARVPAGRAVGVWLLLWALLANSWLLQSHVHCEEGGAHGAALVHLDDCRPGADCAIVGERTPPPSHCPLCQQLAQGAIYLPPALPAIALRSVPPMLLRTASGAPAEIAPRAYHWSSRGPPRL